MAIAIALLIAAAYAAGAVYLNSAAFRHKLLQQANAAMDGHLALGHHHLGLLSGRLTLVGIRLTDTRGVPLFTAKRLSTRLFWPALFWRSIHIKTLVVEHARLQLQYTPEDRLPLVRWVSPSDFRKKESRSTGRWALRIDELRLSGGSVHVERPARGWSGEAKGVEIAANIELANPGGHVQIQTGPVHWQQPDVARTLPAIKLSATVDSGNDVTLTVETPRSEVKASGRFNWATGGSPMEVSGDLDVDLEEIQAWLPDRVALRGRFGAHVNAQGRFEDPALSMHAAWTEGAAMGVSFNRLDADLHLEQRRISIAALRSQSDWGALDLTGSIDLQPVFGSRLAWAAARWEALTYDLKLIGENLQPARLERLDSPVGGHWQLDATLTGDGLTGPRAKGKSHIDLHAKGLTLVHGGAQADGRFSTDLQWTGSSIALNRLELSMGHNELQASAGINPSTGRIQHAEVRLQAYRLDEIGSLLGIERSAGAAEAKVSIQGSFRRPTARVDLLTQDMKIDGLTLGRLLAEAQLDEQGVLRFSRLVLENQGSLIEGSGRLDLLRADGRLSTDPGVALNLVLQQIEPADFGWAPSVGGNLNGRVDLAGSIHHLKAEAVLDESAIAWHNFSANVQGRALWDDGHLSLSSLNVSKGSSSARLKGSLTWRQKDNPIWMATPLVQADMAAHKIQLQDFFSDQRGTLSIEGQVSGPASHLDGQFQLSGTEWVITGQRFHTLGVKGRLSGDKIYCDSATIGIEKDQMVTARGWYAFNRRFELNLEAVDIGLANIAALQRAYPMEGRMDFRLDAAGSIDNPSLNADLTVRQPRLDHQPWEDFHLKLDLSEQQLALSANLNFNLKAHYRIDSGDFDLQADFDRCDLSPYLALWAGAGWGGRLSGVLQAKGNRQRIGLIRANLALKNAVLRHKDLTLLNAPELNARLDQGRLTLPATRLGLLQNGFINISGTGPLEGDVQVATDGRLPMAALAPFFEQFDNAEGEMVFQARAWGPLAKMQWHANLDFSDVGFEIPGLGQPMTGLNGRLEITPLSLSVQALSGRMDGGRFNLAGELRLKDWQPSQGQLTLTAQALPLQWPGTMDLVVSGDLVLKGDAADPTLSGKLVLLEGSYYKDVRLNLISTITQTRRAVPTPVAFEMSPLLRNILVDVGVTHRYPLLVDNNMANLQIAPDLKISGTLARPILSGRAQVVAGEVIFRRKVFTVKRGVVDFINPYKIEPNLDILAEAQIRQWQVSLALTGPPDQLVFKLSSNPPESENDILSLILLGRTGSELAQGERGGRTTTQQMLAALIATAWGEDVKKRSGVDILEVETGAGDDSESADRLQVTVGKKLSRRLTLKYEVESGDEELVQRAVSEYRFLEHLLASGFQDSTGKYGGELLFRIEF